MEKACFNNSKNGCMRSGLIFFLYLSLSIFLKVASSLPTETFYSAVVQLPRHSNSLQHNKECYVPYYAAHHASLSITISQSLPKLRCNKLVVPSDHLIVCQALLLLHSSFPSIRVFSYSQFFASGGESIRVSASAKVLPMNIQG